MAKKKDASFYQAKAQILKDLGISAEVHKELVATGLTYSESHAKAIAEGKGQSLADFEKEVDDKAHGDVTSTAKILTIEGEVAQENAGADETKAGHEFQLEQKAKKSKTNATSDVKGETSAKSETK